jgi:hypothetical protein
MTITDNEGVTDTDTLYVTVVESEPPTVDLAGPSEVDPDTTESFTMTAAAGDAPLSSASWTVDGESIDSRFISDRTWTRNINFGDVGTQTVGVVVTDTRGRQARANQSVSITEDDRNNSDESDSEFAVDIQETNSPVAGGETLTTDITVENNGDAEDIQEIILQSIDGTSVDGESVSLDGDESASITLEWDTESGDTGSGSITAASDDDTDDESVEITGDDSNNGNSGQFSVNIVDTNSPVEEGETLTVDAEVENSADVAGEQSIVFESLYGESVDSEPVALESDEQTTVQLEWETERGDAGSGYVNARSEDDSDDGYVEIESDDDGPVYDIEIVDTNAPVTEGETLSAEVEVTNVGSSAFSGVYLASLQNWQDSYTTDTERQSHLDTGKSTTHTLTWDTEAGDAGTGDIEATVSYSSFEGSDTETVTVESSNPDFDVEITNDNTPIEARFRASIDAEVTNTGETGSQDIRYQDMSGDWQTVESNLQLDAGETAYLNGISDSSEDDSGSYPVEIASDDDSDSETLTLTENTNNDDGGSDDEDDDWIYMRNVPSSVEPGDRFYVSFTLELDCVNYNGDDPDECRNDIGDDHAALRNANFDRSLIYADVDCTSSTCVWPITDSQASQHRGMQYATLQNQWIPGGLAFEATDTRGYSVEIGVQEELTDGPSYSDTDSIYISVESDTSYD